MGWLGEHTFLKDSHWSGQFTVCMDESQSQGNPCFGSIHFFQKRTTICKWNNFNHKFPTVQHFAIAACWAWLTSSTLCVEAFCENLPRWRNLALLAGVNLAQRSAEGIPERTEEQTCSSMVPLHIPWLIYTVNYLFGTPSFPFKFTKRAVLEYFPTCIYAAWHSPTLRCCNANSCCKSFSC